MPVPTRICHAWICPPGSAGGGPLFGSLELDSGRIASFREEDFARYRSGAGRPGRARAPATRAGNSEIDAAGRVVTVPRVNFHEHLYSRLAKGLDLGRPLDSFVNILENFWWAVDRALDADMVEACARVGALEAIRSGVTVLFDHHASPGCLSGSLDILARVLGEAGLRGVLSYECSDRNGAAEAERGLAENRRFLSAANAGDLRGLLGLHASFTLSDRTLETAAALAREFGAGIHIHLAEAAHDREHCLRSYGVPPTVRLERFGLLDRPGILAHGVNLSDLDREALARRPCALALNPDSNLNNAVGLPEYRSLPGSVPLLAGTDGMHGDPGRSLKQLFLLSRHQGFSAAESFAWLQRIAADQERFVRGFFPDHPALAAGDRADLVLWDYRPPSPLDRKGFWGHYLYGVLESPAWAVLQEGRLLYQGGRHLTQDAEAVAKAASRQGERLFEALGAMRR